VVGTAVGVTTGTVSASPSSGCRSRTMSPGTRSTRTYSRSCRAFPRGSRRTSPGTW
jgi:hypothetical protein